MLNNISLKKLYQTQQHKWHILLYFFGCSHCYLGYSKTFNLLSHWKGLARKNSKQTW